MQFIHFVPKIKKVIQTTYTKKNQVQLLDSGYAKHFFFRVHNPQNVYPTLLYKQESVILD